MKKQGALVDQISLHILMDNQSTSEEHREQVRKLLQLAGVGDDVAVGSDPRADKETLEVICGVMKNFDVARASMTPAKRPVASGARSNAKASGAQAAAAGSAQGAAAQPSATAGKPEAKRVSNLAAAFLQATGAAEDNTSAPARAGAAKPGSAARAGRERIDTIKKQSKAQQEEEVAKLVQGKEQMKRDIRERTTVVTRMKEEMLAKFNEEKRKLEEQNR